MSGCPWSWQPNTREEIHSSTTIESHMLSIRLLGKSSLHLTHTPQSEALPLKKKKKHYLPNIKLAQFSFLIIFATVLLCFFMVLLRAMLDCFWLKSCWILPVLWLCSVFFLLSQGGELAFPYLGQESLKRVVFFLFSCVAFHSLYA